jgi:endo-1,4-beta-D-glucanase Y
MNDDMKNLLAQAAALRASGTSWKKIAATLNRDLNTVLHWPQRYPDDWARHRLAEDHLTADAFGESITSLRLLMRSENEKSRLAASVAVVKMRTEQRRLEVMQSRVGAVRRSDGKPQELSTDGQKIAGILDGMSMEQMQEMARRVRPALLAIDASNALKPVQGGEPTAAPGGGTPNAPDAAHGTSGAAGEGNGGRDEE